MSQDLIKQVDRHLSSANLSWLLGAGISVAGNIPLMYPLTERVLSRLKEKKSANCKLVDSIVKIMPDEAHVEQYLNYLGDCYSIVSHMENSEIDIGGTKFSKESTEELYAEIVEEIAFAVRWGYEKIDDTTERAGVPGEPIVEIETHCEFVKALFHSAHAGLHNRRSGVSLFTTNYDTLLEDALSVESISYWDGFTGGAIAYRSHFYGDILPENQYSANVVKLHGSIDWSQTDDGKLMRIREFDLYPKSKNKVMIYPQATKYLATQRDPFSMQFELFRNKLSNNNDNVLAVCGYSFSDEHINDEIATAMNRRGSRTTLLIFVNSQPDCVREWQQTEWGDRVYSITSKGIEVGVEGLQISPEDDGVHEWWKFTGVTQILKDGMGSFL